MSHFNICAKQGLADRQNQTIFGKNFIPFIEVSYVDFQGVRTCYKNK